MTVETNNLRSNQVFEEFSPRKLILQVRSSVFYLRSKWIIILSFAIITGIAAAVYYSFKKPNYTAEITFALDEGVTQAGNPDLSELSDALGLPGTFDAGTIFSSMTNIVELMQSRLLIEKTLRSSVIIDNKAVMFADFFLDSLNYREKWLKTSPYPKLNFASNNKSQKETLYENSIVRSIYETLITKNLKIDRKGKGTTIIAVTCISSNELFSKYFLEALLNEVTQYYIETKTQRSKISVEVIQKRTDSIRLAYNKALYGRAAFTDAHINPSRQTVSVTGEKQQTDVQILRASYVELVRSLENAKTSLMRDTPLIQYLDTPILPLRLDKPSVVKKFILFFLIGGFLITGFLLVRKLYNYILLERTTTTS